jgi:hypothetical protein
MKRESRGRVKDVTFHVLVSESGSARLLNATKDLFPLSRSKHMKRRGERVCVCMCEYMCDDDGDPTQGKGKGGGAL